MISIRRSPTSHPAEKQNAKREASALTDNRCFRPRACLKNHFRHLRAPLCGRFYPHSVDVARYVHSHYNFCAKDDLEAATELAAQVIKGLDGERIQIGRAHV